MCLCLNFLMLNLGFHFSETKLSIDRFCYICEDLNRLDFKIEYLMDECKLFIHSLTYSFTH